MSQVHNHSNNEFIFGDKGGRGKHLLSFLKNLSLTGTSLQKSHSSENIREANSNIYGNLAYGYNSPDSGGSTIAMGQENHNLSPTQKSAPRRFVPKRSVSATSSTDLSLNARGRPPAYIDVRLPSPFHKQVYRTTSSSGDIARGSSRGPTYADLDDDWDAKIEKVDDRSQAGQSLSSQNHVGNKDNGVTVPELVDSMHPDLTSIITSRTDKRTEQIKPPVSQTNTDTHVLSQQHSRIAKFRKILTDESSSVNINDLRKVSWNGIPPDFRAITWQLLLGYLPTNKTRQESTLKRKRQEYVDGLNNISSQISFDETETNNTSVGQNLESSNKDNSQNKEKQLYHQINIDVKRTHPSTRLYANPSTQKSLRKILFLWSVRHPASGYVQGINDLCTPFYQIFLNNYLWQLRQKRTHDLGIEDDLALFIPGLIDETGSDFLETQLLESENLMGLTLENIDVGLISPRVTAIIEADTYWCLSRLLDNITDNYIHEQPGILKQVDDLRNLISKIDLPLLEHLEAEGVEFIQFSFRWMNCLLMRELSIGLIIRMWDTYLSETPIGFNMFHVYVCAAFLIKFSIELKEKDFQEILLFLQNPPTSSWSEKDIELMLSEAFIWQSLYKNASAHLR